MKITATDDGMSVVDLERYEDLLTIRALPRYRFTGWAQVECDPHDLAQLGHAEAVHRPVPPLAAHLFDFQAWVTARAFERERFAAFMLTGLGKTCVQLEWARLVTDEHKGRTLIVAPLNVVGQTIGEASRFYDQGLELADLTDRQALDRWLTDGAGIGITNYEKLDGTADRLPVDAVVLDESSMLRSFGGSRKWSVMRAFSGLRYKLCCSATPSPNDRTEYAHHATFLGYARSTTEYLTAYFRNSDGEWTFKAHAREAWVANLASWAVFMHDPAAWGFSDGVDALPPMSEEFPVVDLTIVQSEYARRWERGEQPSLLGATPGGVTSRTKMAQISNGFLYDDGRTVEIPTNKPQAIAVLVNDKHADDQVIVWVEFDREGDRLADLIPGAVHLSGKTARAKRDAIIDEFRAGSGPRVLLLKPAMFAMGLNLQACTVQVFSTLRDSFERYFQCVRRSWRYGQTKPVHIYVPLTPLDEAMATNVMTKQATFLADAAEIERAVIGRLRPRDTSEVPVTDTAPQAEIDRTETDRWTLVHGDCIAHMPTMSEASVDLAVFSPPFASLFAYSKSIGDMGNVRDSGKNSLEYRLQWRWFAEALLRVVKPGRIAAIHCKEIIRFANADGHRWCYDYPSELRQGMEDAGWHYHRRITIAKNPQSEATRNKETSLLHVTVRRNALNAFPQTGEYLMVFSAPGDPEIPVPVDLGFEEWCEWANSIWPDWGKPWWYGIRETDVLNTEIAKESPDERHVCPLQLGLIERVIRLWSNPDELVFSPFAGIGSEGWEAVAWGRRFYGVELKRSYFDTACRNLAFREAEVGQRMFSAS